MIAHLGVLGALIVLAMPAHAQSESQAQVEPSAGIGQAVPSATSAKTDATTTPVPSPQLATEVEAFIAKLDSATHAIYENGKKDPALVRDGCRDLLNGVLNLTAMARATNTEIWEQMTPPQRETLRAAFENRMVSNCVRQFGRYDGEYMRLAGVRPTDDGELLATVRVGAQDDEKLVTWRLQNSGAEGFRAVDVITEGRSAVVDARNEFAAVLQSVNGDIDALIAFMQKSSL